MAPAGSVVLQDGPDVLIEIRVQPRAAKNELVARPPGALTVRLTAPPVDGAANLAACRFVAELLHLPRSRVLVERGETSRQKRLRIKTADAAAVESRLFAAAR